MRSKKSNLQWFTICTVTFIYLVSTSSLLRVNNLSEWVGNASSSVLVFVSTRPDYKHLITIHRTEKQTLAMWGIASNRSISLLNPKSATRTCLRYWWWYSGMNLGNSMAKSGCLLRSSTTCETVNTTKISPNYSTYVLLTQHNRINASIVEQLLVNGNYTQWTSVYVFVLL